MALAAYRHLLRSTRIAFQGDTPVLLASRHQARTAFEKNSSLSSSSTECKEAIKHALEVSQILRQNVVQGRKLDEDTDKESARYKLRIHEHIERGDNDTIKLSCKGNKVNPK
ncbi:Mitochondrial zinc maintenance protein 1, mitochondrial [Golovinomyces cichoracearum]|uniref:Mitochondrial zinc maintenance protein 1, mitochondrial n=1 Tax=Golovinomyces cichoracearum TaxID=62708 RepID=A0A420I8D5_9PEZI|nr:Mitochondrial zinc maintenance protein 1, mitochondrial [Golovinomyces cichoracearum]RKF80199.1 Mitochondrial zinc maintenance protein 1, mitochondrial [Golovinomyces cichoracearum]